LPHPRMDRRMPKYTDAQIEGALKHARGMVYVAARALGCSPNTIKKRVSESDHLQEVQESERGLLLDTAELKLAQAINDGDMGAIKYLLSTQGQGRGYVERRQLEHTGPLPVLVVRKEG
jgi:hypothetical protein